MGFADVRPIDLQHDLPAVVDLLSRTRASGGLSHPGGIQWWLRLAGGRDDFEAFVWPAESRLSGFALIDGTFVVAERADDGPTALEQLAWLERHMRARGVAQLQLHVAEGDPLLEELERRGYTRSGTELELLADTANEPVRAPLPAGFRMASLEDVSDDVYIAGHRAAWSDTKPSSYRRELHEAVKQSPQFRPDLVTIVLAPDGTVAACCIGWLDERTQTLEIEPLGTHRNHRRLGWPTPWSRKSSTARGPTARSTSWSGTTRRRCPPHTACIPAPTCGPAGPSSS